MDRFFKDLLEYGHHFNQLLADKFLEYSGRTSEKPVRLFNHIVNAHHIWNNRIDPQQPVVGVWDIHDIGELKKMDATNYDRTLKILEKIEPEKMIVYSNSKGATFTNLVKDIIFHIINHSTYHRGQIAMEFRQSGLEPLNTDYIFYKR